MRKILEVVRKLVNEYMQNLDRRQDDWISMTTIVDHSGSVNESANNKIVMTIYNICRENIVSTYVPARQGEDQFSIVSPPIYITLRLAFIANFWGAHYADGVAAISRVISYFQQTPSFTLANAPDLGPDIERITLEMENLDPVDVNYVMGMFGTKYLPSAFYKLRLLPYASTALQARTYPVSGSGIAESPTPGGAAS